MMSPDGKYFWDGQKWVAVASASDAGHRSVFPSWNEIHVTVADQPVAPRTQPRCQRQPSQLSEFRPRNPRSMDSSGAEMSVLRTVRSAGGQREFFRKEKIDGPRPKSGMTPAILSNVKESGH